MEFLLKKNLAVCLIVSIVMSQSLTPTVALTTNNRILLSSVLVGSALAASICKLDLFSDGGSVSLLYYYHLASIWRR